MRLAMGPGYLHASSSSRGYTQTISGGGFALNFAFGGAVAPNLIVFGELSGTSAIDPSFKETGSASESWNNTTVSMISVGPGIAYYVPSVNVYFSGAITISQLTASDNSDNNSNSDSVDLSESGVGGSFMVGKEWWVTRDWGVGIASMLQLASMKSKMYGMSDSRWFATAWSVLFSATYN
jgi:hypothetical protein